MSWTASPNPSKSSAFTASTPILASPSGRDVGCTAGPCASVIIRDRLAYALGTMSDLNIYTEARTVRSADFTGNGRPDILATGTDVPLVAWYEHPANSVPPGPSTSSTPTPLVPLTAIPSTSPAMANLTSQWPVAKIPLAAASLGMNTPATPAAPGTNSRSGKIGAAPIKF